jgi:hypothetical protein
MVYIYVRKPNQRSLNENNIQKAIRGAALGTFNFMAVKYNTSM